MKAIILAAGRGERNFPYDLTRQKAALPVGNIPLVRWTVQCLQRAGISDICVVTGHLEQRVKHALLGFDVCFVTQKEPGAGTCPATLDALTAIGFEEPVVVVYGDCLIDEAGLAQFVKLYKNEQPPAGAMLAPLAERDSLNWLCAGLDGDCLRGISGHPRGAEHRLCGVYYLSPATLPYLQANPGLVTSVNVGGMPKLEAELAQSIQLMLDAGLPVRAFEHTGLFVDLDKPWHVQEANHSFTKYLCSSLLESSIAPDAQIHEGAEITGNIVLGPGVIIGNRVVLHGNTIIGAKTHLTNGAIVGGDCIIGANARIREYCLIGGGSVVGDECVIGHGAELFGVCFEGVYLYHYCEMSGVFGARYDAGAATVCGTLRFDDGDTAHVVRGRREMPESGGNDAYLADFTRTGVNAMLMPGVKIGSYSCVGPGVIQYEDVPHNTLILAKQETEQRPWGPNRYGW